jgi:hypothetical protein
LKKLIQKTFPLLVSLASCAAFAAPALKQAKHLLVHEVEITGANLNNTEHFAIAFESSGKQILIDTTLSNWKYPIVVPSGNSGFVFVSVFAVSNSSRRLLHKFSMRTDIGYNKKSFKSGFVNKIVISESPLNSKPVDSEDNFATNQMPIITIKTPPEEILGAIKTIFAPILNDIISTVDRSKDINAENYMAMSTNISNEMRTHAKSITRASDEIDTICASYTKMLDDSILELKKIKEKTPGLGEELIESETIYTERREKMSKCVGFKIISQMLIDFAGKLEVRSNFYHKAPISPVETAKKIRDYIKKETSDIVASLEKW